MVICTTIFEAMAHITAKNMGFPNIPLIVTPHPIGGLKIEEVKIKGEIITEKLINLLS